MYVYEILTVLVEVLFCEVLQELIWTIYVTF